MAKKVHAKSTKAELLEAFQELESAYKELEQKTTSNTVTSSPSAQQPETSSTPTTPVKGKSAAKKTEVSFAEISHTQAQMGAIIQALTQLGEQFNTALSQLSSHLLVEAARLKDIRTQVSNESNRLSHLYGLEIEEATLSKLLKQYTETAQQYEETVKQQREEAEQALKEQTQAWEIEKEEMDMRLQEQEVTDKKSQQREATEYSYNVTLAREVSDEEYAQQQKQQQHALELLEEGQRQAWEEREKALAEREKQFAEYQTKVERFPKELEVAIKKAKEEGTGIARHQAKIKAELIAKEFAGEEEVYQLKITSLEEEVAHQTTQIDKLSQQLEATLKQAQELAVKAIEGASSHTSFQALKEIALEQAKNQPKVK